MTEYIIDLQPKLIKKLNQQLIEILKMPEELLMQYISNPSVTENEQKLLKNAAYAYQSGKYLDAIAYYKKCNIFIGKKKGVNINNNNEESQWSVLVQYLLSKCLLKSDKFIDLLEAKKILLQLEESEGKKYPMIYYILAEIHIKLFCFEDAELTINKCLAILNSKNSKLINYYIPLTNDIIAESTNQCLSIELLKLKKQCTGWHRPDALCFMTNCQLNSEYHLSGRNIYFNSPAYNGMVIIVCDNINSCNITFHSACWKVQKKVLSSGKKMSDRDFLLWDCFTPNCERDSLPSKIERIEIHNKNEVKHIEIPPEKQDRIRYSPSKGAIHKRKIKIIEQQKHSNRKLSSAKKLILNESNHDNNESPNDIDALKSQLLNLTRLRNNNFYIDKSNDWRPDLQYYGNTEFKSKYDKIPLEPDCSDVTKQIAGLKSFLYSYFYQFISKNAPVKIDSLPEKWEAATDIIRGCETILYDSNCTNIVEFLVQSSKFTIMGDYICTPETIPETFALVKSNTCTALRCLMENNEDDLQIADDDENVEKFVLADTEEISLNTISTSSSLININDNNNFTNNNNEELSCNSSDLIIDKKQIPISKNTDCEKEIMTNDDITHENINLPSSKSDESIDIKKMSETIAKDKAEKSTQLIKYLNEQLKSISYELNAKNNQLTDLKMTMLRLSLDSQYLTTNACIQNRLSHFLSQYAIIGKIQDTLMNMLGTQLSLDRCEWLKPIQEIRRISKILIQTYNEKLAEINSKERCNDINDIRLNIPDLPVLPNHNIFDILQIAFDMYYSHWQRLFTSKPIPNSYPQPLNPNPPIFMSPYQNYFLYPNNVHQQSMQPLIPHFALNKPNLPTQRAEIPKPNDAQTKYQSEQLKNIPMEEVETTQSDNATIDIKQMDDVTTVLKDKNQSNGVLNEDVVVKSEMPSMDILLNLLRSRNKGVLVYDLLWSVNQVRQAHNGSLTGMPLSVIINETERLLYVREKLQLFDYSGKSITEVSRNLQNHQPQRKISVSSTSSYASTNSISKESKSRKNPWNIINDISATWDSSDVQDECVICFETLRQDIKTQLVYTLQCKHTFHKKCIINWFNENQSCPTCRKFSTMDDQFPPL